jgi:hypothetical protein
MKINHKLSIAVKIILIILLLLVVTGCKTKEILVPVEKTVVEYKDRLHVDSIYNRDTLYLFTKNDTVYLQSIKWRERFRIDTISVVKVDSIPYTVEVVKEVNKLTKWQQIRLSALNILIVIIVIYVLIKIKW